MNDVSKTAKRLAEATCIGYLVAIGLSAFVTFLAKVTYGNF